ncbi:nucleotide sugar dehydrogenase [Candidatus Pelagibacter communis]|uniref:nucleotide sugar dehydrogenase n=1 Tax=Pelagibacter ubique TaxID=198252 RepID=UPI00094C34AC|nr:nucleotide sugar dehydrogenase [Candidatus Pelagibacter ubique]
MNKVLCIGLGKLGLIFSFILASKNNFVYGYDIDKKIKRNIDKNIKNAEPKLNSLIKKNYNKFKFEEDFKTSVSNTTCSFVIVPTPSKKNKEFDNKYIYNSLNEIGKYLKNKKKYIINITSTVNPGSCDKFIKHLENKFNLVHGKEFIITYNPHLIALGSIYNDVLNSDVVLIGSKLKYGHNFLRKIYAPLYKKKISKLKFLNLEEAEISKIAINTFITMKISFTNTISQISDKIKNINSSNILDAVGHDTRIGKKYLSLGALFSGPCFPRDNLNFSKYLSDKKLNSSLPKAIDNVNDVQLKRYIKAFNKFNKLKKPTVGICGLSYKQNTNITTRSPGILLYNYFKKKYKTVAYDEYKPDIKITNLEKNLNNFGKKCDVIFVCYQNSKFKKLEKIKYSKKVLIIDLWKFLNFKNKKVILKTIGIS